MRRMLVFSSISVMLLGSVFFGSAFSEQTNSFSAFAAQKDKSNLSASRPATGARVFIFSPRSLRWAVYDANGQFVRSGHAVGGRGYCPDVRRRCRTPVGRFHVYAKAGPSYRSTRFPLPNGGAPMPWAMFFHKGFAIHGSNDVPSYNASHGCIRVYPSDARWLNTNFLTYGSTVVVHPY